MSNNENTGLLERAAEMIDYWEGTVVSRAIEEDIARKDLESLYSHVAEAEAMIAREEFANHEIY